MKYHIPQICTTNYFCQLENYLAEEELKWCVSDSCAHTVVLNPPDPENTKQTIIMI